MIVDGQAVFPIPGYPDYFITKTGWVWAKRKRKRWLKQSIISGYRICSLYNRDGEMAKHYIHRLLLETFVCPCPRGMECNHKNGNRLDVDLGNLEWVTPAENVQNQILRGTHKSVIGCKQTKTM